MQRCTRGDCSKFISYCHVLFVADDKDHVTSPLPILTEREKEVVQQLKQVADTAARQQDELRQAADRETQLQMQLQQETYQRSNLQKELDDLKKCYNTQYCRFYVLNHSAVEYTLLASPLCQ